MERKSSLAGLMAGTIILCHYIDLEVLYLWWIQVLFPVCMSQIPFQCMTFHLTLFMMSFSELKFLILIESDLLVLSLWVVPLCLILKSISYPPWSHKLFLCGVLAPEIFTDFLRCVTEENTLWPQLATANLCLLFFTFFCSLSWISALLQLQLRARCCLL